MSLRDAMRDSAVPYLEPGEQVQAVIGAQTASQYLAAITGVFVFLGLNRYRILAVTPTRIVVLDAGKTSMKKARGVVTELPRSTRLGPATGHVAPDPGRPGNAPGAPAVLQGHRDRRQRHHRHRVTRGMDDASFRTAGIRSTPAVGDLGYRSLSRSEGGITLAALTAISGEGRSSGPVGHRSTGRVTVLPRRRSQRRADDLGAGGRPLLVVERPVRRPVGRRPRLLAPAVRQRPGVHRPVPDRVEERRSPPPWRPRCRPRSAGTSGRPPRPGGPGSAGA